MYEGTEVVEMEWLLLGISKNEILGFSMRKLMEFILLKRIDLELRILYNGCRGV